MLQYNPVVGDVCGNTVRMIKAIRSMDADVIVTPELSICGYPPRDLLCCDGFVQGCEEAVEQIAEACKDITVLVGHPRIDATSGRIRNSVSVLQEGEIVAIADKQLIASYDVFDEKRYFESGDTICTFALHGTTIGIAICEDFWCGLDASAAPTYDYNPIRQLLDAHCNVIISPSASPFVTGKHETHLAYALDLAREHNVTIAVCNQVGGNDDLVFDGGSFVVSQGGLLGALPLFEKGTIVIDTQQKPVAIPSEACEEEERFNALVLGTKDYFCKTGHSQALLGISGGIDSAVVATLAVAALGKDAVTGILMPSRYSSLGSVEDAEQLAANLGIACETLPIEHMHAAFERTITDSCLEATGLTQENAQARIRGLLLMARANQEGALLLATGNKSELAVGYSTLYGDMSGAVAVIGDIYKTDVWAMAKWINNNYKSCGFNMPPIPESSIAKPPSAELRPDQLDQDSLPQYDALDAILRLHVDFDMGVDAIEEELDAPREFLSKIIQMVDIAQFKRDQAAVIFKTSPRAFGRGRRMPIVMKRNWVTTRETT
jgi:NAD+ synthase (glutamine-hydrolysing)